MMLFFKLLAPLVVFVVALIPVASQEKWLKLHDGRTKFHKIAVAVLICMMVIFTCITLAIVWSDAKHSEDLEKEVKRKTQEIIDLGKTNIAISSELVDLSKQLREWSSGGDSYCYFWLPSYLIGGETNCRATLVQVGEYPVYDIRATFVDLNLRKKLLKPFGFDWPDEIMHTTEINVDIGNTHPNAVSTTSIGTTNYYFQSYYYNFRVPTNEPRQVYQVVFSTRNGLWDQQIRMVWTNGLWYTACKVKKYNPERLLIQHFARGYPDGPMPW